MDVGADMHDALPALPEPGVGQQQRDVDSSMNILFKDMETAMMNGILAELKNCWMKSNRLCRFLWLAMADIQ